MVDIFSIVGEEIIGQFMNPQKRLFLGYLFGGFLIGFIWMKATTRQSTVKIVKTVFSRDVWLSRSSYFDLIFFLINRGVALLAQPVLITQLFVATIFYQALHNQTLLPIGALDYVPYWVAATSFTITYFLLNDFSRFLLHLMLHRVKFLWEFHKVHHSATTLTPLTVTRTHPVEGLLFMLNTTITQGVIIAVFVALFGAKVDLITIFGVNIFTLAFNSLGSNLRHSHIALPYPKIIEKIFISPAQHQLHHSRKVIHFDKNFGVVFSIWDRILGTFHHSTSDKMEFGLGRNDAKLTASIWSLYVLPFAKLFSFLRIWPFTKVPHLVKQLHRMMTDSYQRLR